MNAAGAIALQFEAMTLAQLDAAVALQRRYDNKYIVSADQLESVALELSATHRALEIDGRRVFEYRSVYFDSESLLTYRGHTQRRRRRFKCRCRFYVDAGIHQFEVKLKGRRGMTVKKRIAYSDDTFGKLTDEARAFLRETLVEAYGYELDQEFRPIVETHYRRMTLASLVDQERVTCDFDLRFLSADGRAYELDKPHLVVESKSASGRGIADQALRAVGARPLRVSKYVLGVALTHPEVRGNDLRRLMRTLCRDVPAALIPPPEGRLTWSV